MNISCFTLDSAVSKMNPVFSHRQIAFRSILILEGLIALELLLTLGIFSWFSLGKSFKKINNIYIYTIFPIPNCSWIGR